MTTPRRGQVAAAVLWIAAALLFLALEAMAAAAVVPSYSYTHGYISDLGVPAWSPKAAVMNTAFWIQGLGFLAGALAFGRGGWFIGLAAANAFGNILVATAHGGSTLVAHGYAWLHVVGALLAIVGGNAAIVVGSSTIRQAIAFLGYRFVSVAIAVVGFACLALLGINASKTALAPGVLERGSVYSILAWQILTGFLLVRETAFRQRKIE